MSGQRKSFEDQNQMVDNYIERVGLYEQPEPLDIDLREYLSYVRKNHIPSEEINEELVNRFRV